MADIDLLNKIDEIYAKNYLSKILESKLLKYFTVSHLQIQKKNPWHLSRSIDKCHEKNIYNF